MIKRLPNETNRAYSALLEYLTFGPTRSLEKLRKSSYQSQEKLYAMSSVKEWSIRYNWVARSQAFDDRIAANAAAAYETRRAAIMDQHLALTHERVEKLYKIFAKLEPYLENEATVWLAEPKMVGEERVDIMRFNAPLFDQLRKVLADIAAEVGGRVKHAEISGKDGQALVTQTQSVNLSLLSDEELETLDRLVQKAEL